LLLFLSGLTALQNPRDEDAGPPDHHSLKSGSRPGSLRTIFRKCRCQTNDTQNLCWFVFHNF